MRSEKLERDKKIGQGQKGVKEICKNRRREKEREQERETRSHKAIIRYSVVSKPY